MRFSAGRARPPRSTELWNRPGTIAWNIDKRYLRELEQAGVPTVPTLWAEPGADLPAVPWDDVIVKPVVDLGARNLVRVRSRRGRRGRAYPRRPGDGAAVPAGARERGRAEHRARPRRAAPRRPQAAGGRRLPDPAAVRRHRRVRRAAGRGARDRAARAGGGARALPVRPRGPRPAAPAGASA